MSTKSIANCSNKATVEEDAMRFNEEKIKAAEQHIGDHLNVQDWVNSWEAAEESITSTEMLADTEIVEQIRQEPEEDDTENMKLSPTKPAKTHSEAVSHLK